MRLVSSPETTRRIAWRDNYNMLDEDRIALYSQYSDIQCNASSLCANKRHSIICSLYN